MTYILVTYLKPKMPVIQSNSCVSSVNVTDHNNFVGMLSVQELPYLVFPNTTVLKTCMRYNENV